MTELTDEDRAAIIEATRQSALALVRDQPTVERIYNAGKAAEREACAKLCEADLTMVAWQCADAIRARGK